MIELVNELKQMNSQLMAQLAAANQLLVGESWPPSAQRTRAAGTRTLPCHPQWGRRCLDLRRSWRLSSRETSRPLEWKDVTLWGADRRGPTWRRPLQAAGRATGSPHGGPSVRRGGAGHAAGSPPGGRHVTTGTSGRESKLGAECCRSDRTAGAADRVQQTQQTDSDGRVPDSHE